MGFEAGNICCCSLEEQISKLFKLFRQRRHEIQFVFQWVSLKFESFAFSSSGIPSVIVPPNFGWTQVGLTSKLGLIFLQSRLQIAAKMSATGINQLRDRNFHQRIWEEFQVYLERDLFTDILLQCPDDQNKGQLWEIRFEIRLRNALFSVPNFNFQFQDATGWFLLKQASFFTTFCQTRKVMSSVLAMPNLSFCKHWFR